MTNWARTLCSALDEREAGLAAACGLDPDADGEAFEISLGLLLDWEQAQGQVDRFFGLGAPSFRESRSGVLGWRQTTRDRLETVRDVVIETLYSQFGQERVDHQKAISAYEAVLDAAGQAELLVATTNYDRSAEAALESLGHQVDLGFTPPDPQSAPRLEPAGLVNERNGKTPVIHLHGAVGWYELDGIVKDHRGEGRYYPSLGSPVVLYPDPKKDPLADAYVAQLWNEFEDAAKSSTAILVIGHSLHDAGLVRVLNSAAESLIPVIVSYFDKTDHDRVKEEIPKASATELQFGPKAALPKKLITNALSAGPQ